MESKSDSGKPATKRGPIVDPNIAGHVNLSGLYEQSSLACCHYSGILANMRIIAVTQGLVVLAAAAYLAAEGNEDGYFNSYWVCGFGVCFSVVIWYFLRNYLEHFLGIVRWTEALERAQQVFT